MLKKNLLISFSGGETSAYMAQWLWKNKRDEFNMVFVFANTGLENDETIRFSRRCEAHFGFKVHYIEAVVHHGQRKSNSHKVLEPYRLSTEGEPFEDFIKKHGIPNQKAPSCTRELKQAPIKSFAKEYFNGETYLTAIGIRPDEIDRVNKNRVKLRIIYPLLDLGMTKPKINFWWSQQPFRLELKGYQGNCITCWKKSDRKLFQIYKENPRSFLFMDRMEQRYGEFIPESRQKLMLERGENPEEKFPITFFRGNRSTYDICKSAQSFDGEVTDDADVYDDSESCEVFSECGDN